MKKKNKTSVVVSPRSLAKKVIAIFKGFADDGVTVYAAQAAFYTVIASIPFLMLLISLGRYIAPDIINTLFVTIRKIIPERFDDLFVAIYEELIQGAGVSLVSITALTALWSSSRAVSAVIKGVAFIYDAEKYPGMMYNLLYSLLYTVTFVALILGALVVLVFGGAIKNAVVYRFPQTAGIFSLILSLRGVVFFISLTLFFSIIYYAVSKNILRASGTLRSYASQLPGAVFASAGWMLFSYFYSLYLKFYPNASYIYGSLAAVMLMMFWLYFCMIILLAGAEINKLLTK